MDFIIIFIFLGVFFFYPMLVGGALYLTAYLIFRKQLKKREMRGLDPIRPLYRALWHLLFFALSAICVFLVGLISLGFDEILAWNLVPATVAYIVGAATYVISRLITNKVKPTEDPNKQENRRFVSATVASTIFVVVFSLIAFVMALMIGLSFVVLTLM